MLMQELLFSAVKQNILRYLDVQFAMTIADNNEPAVMLAAALLSREVGNGHVCLPLVKLTPNNKTPEILHSCFKLIGSIDWVKTLLCSIAISDGSSSTPLILQYDRLYFHRMWRNEVMVSHFFNKKNHSLPYDKKLLSTVLNELFKSSKELVNWQKVAVAVAITRRISVISGGPGTGKTTTIAKLLVALIKMAGEKPCRIQLAAPTGKAAANLSELLKNTLLHLNLTEIQSKVFPTEASTLHRLLGIHQASNQYVRYNASNPMHLDVLIVDEASMIDLTMMSRLINALPAHARVVFLGDRDQLASVEAGAVLGDICSYANKGYTLARSHELIELTGCLIPINDYDDYQNAGTVRDSLCLLQKNYRFNSNSGISHLAEVVNRGNYRAIKTIFSGGFSDIKKNELKSEKDYFQMLNEVVEGYFYFLKCVWQKNNAETILLAFNQFRLLCPMRTGPFGVTGLNDYLEKMLFKIHNIERNQYYPWYEGRPVIILRNDSMLGLYNGDIGVALAHEHTLKVWFQLSSGNMKSVQPNRLPKHETAWAMTVHKSQGSEFDHVALILPTEITPIVTRELIYTAITRARKRLSLYANDRILRRAILTSSERCSGLKLMLAST